MSFNIKRFLNIGIFIGAAIGLLVSYFFQIEIIRMAMSYQEYLQNIFTKLGSDRINVNNYAYIETSMIIPPIVLSVILGAIVGALIAGMLKKQVVK